MNLIINCEDDDKLILSDEDAVLAWRGIGKKLLFKPLVFLLMLLIENETELSFFNGADYLEFKQHPDLMKW